MPLIEENKDMSDVVHKFIKEDPDEKIIRKLWDLGSIKTPDELINSVSQLFFSFPFSSFTIVKIHEKNDNNFVDRFLSEAEKSEEIEEKSLSIEDIGTTDILKEQIQKEVMMLDKEKSPKFEEIFDSESETKKEKNNSDILQQIHELFNSEEKKKIFQENLRKMTDIMKDEKKTSEVLANISDEEKEKIIQSFGGKKQSGCANLPQWKDLKGFKDVDGLWQKILLPLNYNDWFWKKISCNVKPWICPIAPIFCLEQYIYEKSEKEQTTFWKIFSWLVYFTIEIIEISLIILGTVLDFVVPGAAIIPDIGAVIIAVLRFDIVGVIFGSIGLIPYLGSGVAALSKALRVTLNTTKFALGATKIVKNKNKFVKMIKIVVSLVGYFEKAIYVLKLAEIGVIFKKAFIDSGTAEYITRFIIDNPDFFSQLMFSIQKEKKDDDVIKKANEINPNLIIAAEQLNKIINPKDFEDLSKSLSKIKKKKKMKDSAMAVVGFGYKYKDKAIEIIEQVLSSTDFGKKISEKINELTKKK